jgi:hypothetical protein
MYADNEQTLLFAVDQAASMQDIWQTEAFTFSVGEQPLCLFDTAYAGSELEPDGCLTIELDQGAYSISTALYKPDTSTAALFHRLTLHA